MQSFIWLTTIFEFDYPEDESIVQTVFTLYFQLTFGLRITTGPIVFVSYATFIIAKAISVSVNGNYDTSTSILYWHKSGEKVKTRLPTWFV